jgi:hypothetical protein
MLYYLKFLNAIINFKYIENLKFEFCINIQEKNKTSLIILDFYLFNTNQSKCTPRNLSKIKRGGTYLAKDLVSVFRSYTLSKTSSYSLLMPIHVQNLNCGPHCKSNAQIKFTINNSDLIWIEHKKCAK